MLLHAFACGISILRLLKNRRDWGFISLIEKSRKILQFERIDSYCKFVDNRGIQLLYTNFDIYTQNYYLLKQNFKIIPK